MLHVPIQNGELPWFPPADEKRFIFNRTVP
jgi:hypothetical protein